MRKRQLVFLLFLSAACAIAQAGGGGQSSPPCTSTVVGDLRIEHFDSKVLGVPSGKVEPIIVVGIDSPVEASRAASPHPPLDMRARSSMLVEDPDNMTSTAYRFDFEPHGQRLAPFFTTELMPRIEKEYRVRKDRASTAVGGFSYGGVAAVNLLVELPMVFGIGWIESPSASPANGALARRTQYLAIAPLRAYVGVGDRESMKSYKQMSDAGLDPAAFDRNFAHDARAIADNFKAAGGADPQVLFVEEPEADHSEASWARRFPAAIAFLFPAQK